LTSRSVEANESVDVDRAFGGRVGDARRRGRREAHCGARDATRARGEDRVFSMARDFEKNNPAMGVTRVRIRSLDARSVQAASVRREREKSAAARARAMMGWRWAMGDASDASDR
jgi:hypothetical protein